MIAVRPLTPDDVATAADIFLTALSEMAGRLGMPLPPLDDEFRRHAEHRIAYLQTTDPGGSFVAEHRGAVVGFAQSCQRETLWMLTYLFVLPVAQNRGLGRRLLDAALGHGDPSCGTIMVTFDPRAMHRYLQAGFDLHPMVWVAGAVDRSALPATPGVRVGGVADLDAVAAIDRTVRGAARSGDIEATLRDGAELLVADAGGYALLSDGRVSALAALDEDTGRALLYAGLAELSAPASSSDSPGDGSVGIRRVSAHQQWALRASTQVGLQIGPAGPVMTRGWALPTAPYIFDSTLG